MKTTISLLVILFSVEFIYSQDYNYSFIGDTTAFDANTQFGICLMGGAAEDDNGSQWFLEKANGGNVVVIRASGGDGYNSYFFNDLGVSLSSVETIVFNNTNAANDEFVKRRLKNADAIWIAGGDQFIYEQYWKNSPIQDIINDHINIKQAPIGGTSAGMAILGDYYYNAENGSITSNQALNNPFSNLITLEKDFISIPILENTILDTHYDNPNRKGRHATFIARLTENDNQRFYGIGAEEYTAVCIDENGVATVFGGYPDYDDKVFFIQNNCRSQAPEVIESNKPLTWIGDEQDALIVYEIEAREDGSSTFSLFDWRTGTGGSWKYWTIEEGEITESQGSQPSCLVNASHINSDIVSLNLFPNPSSKIVEVNSNRNIINVTVINSFGQKIINSKTHVLDVSKLENGVYFVDVLFENQSSATRKLVVE